MRRRPLVSIILPTYNRAEYLTEALESVLVQTYSNIELVVVDDASTDKTSTILSQYKKKDSRIVVIRNKTNIGLVKSLNKGVSLAKGPYIARLDDDDRWCQNSKLKTQVDFLERNPDYVLVGGGLIQINRKGEEIVRFLLPESDIDIRKALLLNNPFAHTTVMFRKESWEKVGGYDETLDFSEDWDLWMRFADLGKFSNIPEYFVHYIQDEQNSSRRKVRHHAVLNLKLRIKYRSLFPSFFTGIVIGIAALLPFQELLRRVVFVGVRKEKKRIKICQVATVDLSLRFLLLELMKHLKDSGFEVWGLSSRGKWIKDIESAGIIVKTIEMKREIFTPLEDLAALFHMIAFFRKEQFDIIHTHTPKASFLGQIAGFVAGVPIRVHTVHGLFFQEDSSWRRRKFFMLLEKIIGFFANVVFFVNREDIKTVKKEVHYPKEKIRYFGGGVDTERFNPKKFSQNFIKAKRRELGIPSQTKVIGIVARLVAEKGYFDLFQAFQMVLEKFPKAILLVIGPSEDRKRDGFSKNVVKRYGIAENVIFLGERTDVQKLYAVMDVFVLPSCREGLGLSILEASAMGKPVVATNIRGCREAVDNGKTGRLVPLKNPSELAKALIYVLSHPKKAKSMGEAGRRKVQKEFDEHIAFDRITKEYERLIKEKLR